MVHRRVFLGQDDLGRPVSTGFHAGQDAGLMIALNVIVAEQTKQDKPATVAALDPRIIAPTPRGISTAPAGCLRSGSLPDSCVTDPRQRKRPPQ